MVARYFPELTPRQLEQFAAAEALYRTWNARINLVSRQEADQLEERHLLHSLALVKADCIRPGQRVMDLGCGGGFPGIPLAIYYPQVQFTLVDSIGKKIRVVEAIAEELDLQNVTAVWGRAEAVEGPFDWVVSRAVAPLSDLVAWSWAKSVHGILALKGGDLTAEIAAAKQKARLLPISDWFDEPFFETKKVVILSKK